MAYKCSVCGANDVEHPGDVCELCAIGQDPYASAFQSNTDNSSINNQSLFQPRSIVNTPDDNTNVYVPGKGKSRKVLLGGGASLNNTDPYGNSMTPQQDSSVHVYQAGQTSVSGQSSNQTVVNSTSINNNGTSAVSDNSPLTSGITKNISVDVQTISAVRKLFRTLFQGIPFTLDNDITMFQVFPDYTGTSLNAMGNACDQVIVYGKLNAGAIAENNDVDVYGHRDSNNNIVASRIVNKASGTTATPYRVIPVPAMWAITVAVFALLAYILAMGGIEMIVWAVIILLCLTHLPFILKVIAGILGVIFSLRRRR